MAKSIKAFNPVYSMTDMQDLAAHFNGKCLSKEYWGLNTSLTWKCEKGHVFEAMPSIIKQGGWCKQCLNSPRRKWGLNDMQELARKSGGECMSKEYKSVHLKLKWKCSKGHRWEAIPKTVLKGSWCPYCAGNKRKDISFYKDLAKKHHGKCLSKSTLMPILN